MSDQPRPQVPWQRQPQQPWPGGPQNQPPWPNAPQQQQQYAQQSWTGPTQQFPPGQEPQQFPPGGQPPWPGGQPGRHSLRPRKQQHILRNVILASIGGLLVIGIIANAVGSGKNTGNTSGAPTSSPSKTKPKATGSPAAVTYSPAQLKFFHDVNTHVPALGAGNSALVSIGNAICNLRRTGISQRETIAEQTFLNLTSISQQATLVRLAEKDLCNRYLPLPATPKIIARPAPSTPATPKIIARPAPSTPAVVPLSLCGAPPNPYKLNLCGRGSLVYSPPSDVCSYFNCIPNFPNGIGYMIECNDGMYSMSGGRPGACSSHRGEGTAVTQG